MTNENIEHQKRIDYLKKKIEPFERLLCNIEQTQSATDQQIRNEGLIFSNPAVITETIVEGTNPEPKVVNSVLYDIMRNVFCIAPSAFTLFHNGISTKYESFGIRGGYIEGLGGRILFNKRGFQHCLELIIENLENSRPTKETGKEIAHYKAILNEHLNTPYQEEQND
jgi:hypothetical protein